MRTRAYSLKLPACTLRERRGQRERKRKENVRWRNHLGICARFGEICYAADCCCGGLFPLTFFTDAGENTVFLGRRYERCEKCSATFVRCEVFMSPPSFPEMCADVVPVNTLIRAWNARRESIAFLKIPPFSERRSDWKIALFGQFCIFIKNY